MVRKTDEELLDELKKKKKEVEELEYEQDKKANTANKYLEEAEDDDEKPRSPAVQIIEREVTLGLINEKLNFIIAKVQNLK